MFKAIRQALNGFNSMSRDLSDIATSARGLLDHAQEPSALLPMQAKLDAMEAELGSILGQADEILGAAVRERKDARNAEERTRNREKRVHEASEALEQYREGEDFDPQLENQLPQGDGEGSDPNGLLHVRTRLEARADAKARARAHKYR